MRTELKTITPAIAAEMLTRNVGNRPLKQKKIDELEREIREGRWKVNGDMIRFDVNGNVIDGQHRLNAIVKTKMSVQSWIMEGLPSDVFDTIDIGARRSHGDTFSVRGIKNANRLASALIKVGCYFTGCLENRQSFTNGQVEAMLESYPDLPEYILVSKTTKVLSPSIMDACNYIFSKKDPALAVEFINAIIKGSGLMEDEPFYILRERLVQNSLSKAKLGNYYIFALCILAWNHARKGNKIKTLKLVEREGRLVNFPVAI